MDVTTNTAYAIAIPARRLSATPARSVDERAALAYGLAHGRHRPITLGLIAVALIVSCLLAVAGCSERHPGDGPVTLVFKHAKILGPSDPVPRLLREFEAQHPGVRVRSESLTWSSDEQHQFYVVNLEGGNAGLDVLMLDCIWVPEFVARRLAARPHAIRHAGGAGASLPSRGRACDAATDVSGRSPGS